MPSSIFPRASRSRNPSSRKSGLDVPTSATFAHTLIIAEELSSVRYVNEYNSSVAGEQPAFLNDVVEVFARNAASVEFSNMQDLGQNVWNVTNKNAVHEKDSSVTWVMADLGSKVTLANIGASLRGNGSVAELVGVFFADHDQRFSMNTLSDHDAIATNAETLVKGVLTDKSRVEFRGHDSRAAQSAADGLLPLGSHPAFEQRVPSGVHPWPGNWRERGQCQPRCHDRAD